MLTIAPRIHISRMARRICAEDNREQSPIAYFQRLASAVCSKLRLLDDATCIRVQKALQYSSSELVLFQTPDILKLASDLPCAHPGWRLLSLMVERTGFETVLDVDVPAAMECLGRVKDRLVAGEFTIMRPFAIVVWVLSRQKIRTPRCDRVTFPATWQQIMLHDIQSPALSILETHTRHLLGGDVGYVFAQMTVDS
jgi:hypothetical protein